MYAYSNEWYIATRPNIWCSAKVFNIFKWFSPSFSLTLDQYLQIQRRTKNWKNNFHIELTSTRDTQRTSCNSYLNFSSGRKLLQIVQFLFSAQLYLILDRSWRRDRLIWFICLWWSSSSFFVGGSIEPNCVCLSSWSLLLASAILFSDNLWLHRLKTIFCGFCSTVSGYINENIDIFDIPVQTRISTRF